MAVSKSSWLVAFGGVVCGVAGLAVALAAQDSGPKPQCTNCPGTYLSEGEIKEYVAKAMKERLIDRVPREAVGVWLSHNTGFDMSTLPPRFSLRELNERIVAANASPVGFVGTLAQQYGEDGEITLEEFFDYGLKAATSYGTTVAGTASQIADYLEERFEGSGSRGGFMLRHSQAEQIEALHNIVDLLVPELQRRGRFRKAYLGRTLR